MGHRAPRVAALAAGLLALAPAPARPADDPPPFSGQVVPQLRHTQEVLDVAWARDGSFLATSGGDGSVRLWSPDGRLLRALRVAGLRSRIALSPDGAAVLVADVGSAAGAEIWSTLGKRLRRLPPIAGISYVGSVAWSPAGDYVVVCSRLAPRDACQLLDVEGRPLARLEIPPEAKGTTAVVVAPDGEVVYTAGSRSVVRWSRRGELLSRFEVPDHVGALALSPDGTRLATAPGFDPLALVPRGKATSPSPVTRIHDPSGRVLAKFPSHESGSLSFSADGRWIVSGGEKDGRLLVNDAADGRPVATLRLGAGGQDSPAHVALSPDGSRFALATHVIASGLRFVDLAGRRVATPSAAGSGLNDVALDPTGRVIVTTSADRKVRLWSLEGRLLRRFDGGEEYSNTLAVDPGGRLIVTGSKVLKVWDPRGKLLAQARLDGFGRGLAFAPDGRTLWATDDRGWVTGFALAKDAKTVKFRAFDKESTSAVAVSPGGDLVAVGSAFAGVRLFDRSGKRVGELRLPPQRGPRVQGLAFTPDGRELVVASAIAGHELAVFDLQGNLLRSAKTGNRFVSGGLAVSPGGRWAAVTVNDDVGLYELATLKPAARLRAHRDSVTSLAFTRDERHLVTGSGDGTVRVWSVESGASMAFLSRGDDWAVFTDDGLFDASRGGGELLALVDGMSAYGVDQVALRFNRPDLVYRRMGIGGEELWEHLRRQHEDRLRRAGLRGAGGALGAPRVRIAAQREEGDALLLTLVVEDAAHDLAELQLWVNGVPALAGRGRPLGGGRRAEVTERLALSAGRNHVEASAWNEAGFESRRASTIVERPAGRPGTLWFVGLGVSRHKDRRLDLRFADRDVETAAAALGKAGGRFARVRTLALVNEKVTRAALDEVRTFLAGAAVDDTVVLLAAGHGARDPTEEATFRFVTHDVDPEHLASTAISGDELEGLLAGTAARRRLLLVDACQSGEVDPEVLAAARERAAASQLVLRTAAGVARPDRPRRPYLLTRDRYVYRRLERRSGVVVFSSSLGDEVSLESPALKNGLFTAALLRVLAAREADRDRDGWLSADELEEAVKAVVVKATGGLQHPTVDQDNDLADLRLPLLR
jgi:WD40 repeat protein